MTDSFQLREAISHFVLHKSVITITHKQNFICSKTYLQLYMLGITHEQTLMVIIIWYIFFFFLFIPESWKPTTWLASKYFEQ